MFDASTQHIESESVILVYVNTLSLLQLLSCCTTQQKSNGMVSFVEQYNSKDNINDSQAHADVFAYRILYSPGESTMMCSWGLSLPA